jgi:hypothetical protein
MLPLSPSPTVPAKSVVPLMGHLPPSGIVQKSSYVVLVCCPLILLTPALHTQST